ncbi:hypothetical protein L9F63_009383, partial [Diploptera punctata]
NCIFSFANNVNSFDLCELIHHEFFAITPTLKFPFMVPMQSYMFLVITLLFVHEISPLVLRKGIIYMWFFFFKITSVYHFLFFILFYPFMYHFFIKPVFSCYFDYVFFLIVVFLMFHHPLWYTSMSISCNITPILLFFQLNSLVDSIKFLFSTSPVYYYDVNTGIPHIISHYQTQNMSHNAMVMRLSPPGYLGHNALIPGSALCPYLYLIFIEIHNKYTIRVFDTLLVYFSCLKTLYL